MYIKNEIKPFLPIKDLSNIFVVADFDKTITNGSSKTSWSILSDSDDVPKTYIEERKNLYNHYRPIEIDESMDFNLRSSLIREWFQKHIELFVKYKLSEEVFKNAAKDLRIMEFRPGAKEFITFLHDNNIPLIIISAGIGNFIETFLSLNNCYFDNVYISSNKIIFKDGIAVGVGKNIIHSLNKNEVSLPEDILHKLNGRNDVILLGDQITDLKMVDKHKHNKVYSTCFLTDDYYSLIDKIKENFDIVCESNDNYYTLQNELFAN